MNTFALKPKVQRMALNKALQSSNIGKHGKRKTTLALEKALDKKAESIVEELMLARSQVIDLMKNKISNATYRDLIHSLDVLTKNILLLSGKNTSRIGMGRLLDELEAEDKNVVKFSWKE
jgi:hypothetical protein